MRLQMIARRFAAVALLTLPLTCFATASYGVSLTLSHHGRTFATPSMVVDDGVPAMIRVSGQGGYVLTITVTSAGQDRLMVTTKLESAYGSIHPAMMVAPGETASATVGDIAISVNAHHRGS